MNNLKFDAENERDKIRELIKSLYNITDENQLESFVEDSMKFDVENKYYDKEDDYVKPYTIEHSSDNIQKTTPFESLLTSKFVDENGYDTFVEKQCEISDFKLNEFEDKMHDLDEDLIKNRDFGLKL